MGGKVDVTLGANRPEEREGLHVATGQDVLAVIDDLAGLAVREGGRASAQPAARFENEDTDAAARQPGSRTEAGESGADHDDIRSVHCYLGHSHWRRAMSACTGFGTRVRMENTS